MDSGLYPQHLKINLGTFSLFISPFLKKIDIGILFLCLLTKDRACSPMLQKLANGLLALYFKKSHLGLKPVPLKSARKAINPILQKVTLGLKALFSKKC